MEIVIFGHQVSRLNILIFVGILSRLLFYLSWENLQLVHARKLLTQSTHDFLVEVYFQLCDCLLVLQAGVRTFVRSVLVYLFETEEIYPKMEDLDRKFECGKGVNMPTLGRVHIDNACVVVTGGNPSDIYSILTQVAECYTCPFITSWKTPLGYSEPGNNITAENSFQVNTRYKTSLEILKNNIEKPVCTASYQFSQYGLYNISLDDCSINTEVRPVNAYIPLFWAFVILCFLAGLRLTYQAIYKTSAFRRFLVWVSLRTELQNDLTSQEFSDTSALLENAETEAKRSRRLRSLDAFRGLSISVMIFVNYGGGSYYFFNHSPWNGLTVADLVFPWFIWIMGVSLVISIQSQLRNSKPRRSILRKICVRSLMLVLLGLILNSEGSKNDPKTLRLPGVLQRFGFSYLLVALPEAILAPREFPALENRGKFGWLLDVTSAPGQWLLAIFSGGIHLLITFLLPVPGCPTGYLGPGGLAENGTHTNCTGGAAMWVDVSIFGSQHIYQHPTCHQIYRGTTPHDPEGLLGTLNSLVLVWLGVAAGRVLLVHPTWQGRIKRWLSYAVLTGLAAGALSAFSKNDGLIPVNKNLWSLSFILATASMAFFLLTVMYLLIDVYKFWSGSPLYFPGMNSILLYIGHEMVDGMIPWTWAPISGSHAELLAMNLWGAGLWVFTSYVLYKKRIFFAL